MFNTQNACMLLFYGNQAFWTITLADLDGVAGCNRFVGKVPPKGSLPAIFRTVLPFQIVWWYKLILRCCNNPPPPPSLSKINIDPQMHHILLHPTPTLFWLGISFFCKEYLVSPCITDEGSIPETRVSISLIFQILLYPS